MIFKTKEELIKRAKKDKACYDTIIWADDQPNLETIIKECPFIWRLWALEKGYEQFAEYCNWEKLNGFEWSKLLCEQPQFADRCDWSKLNEDDIRWLLKHRQELISYIKKEDKNG